MVVHTNRGAWVNGIMIPTGLLHLHGSSFNGVYYVLLLSDTCAEGISVILLFDGSSYESLPDFYIASKVK
jgi:hypothetical protein